MAKRPNKSLILMRSQFIVCIHRKTSLVTVKIIFLGSNKFGEDKNHRWIPLLEAAWPHFDDVSREIKPTGQFASTVMASHHPRLPCDIKI